MLSGIGVRTYKVVIYTLSGLFCAISAVLLTAKLDSAVPVAADGYELWSERYDREIEDIFAIQEEIAQAVVRALELQLSVARQGRITRVGTRDAQAYELYLRGRKFLMLHGEPALRVARQMFRGALELDPSFAQAHAGLADADFIMLQWNIDHERAVERRAEALAEMTHARARVEWGYGKDEKLSNEELIAEKYRGIRPAFGYPACPDHTEKRTVFALLDAPANAGITLTESCAMFPTASVSGLLLAHPEAHYFAVGRLGRDQVADYARRKGMPLHEAERWLGPKLGYEAEGTGG